MMKMIHRLIRWLKFTFHLCGKDGCWKKGNPCFLETVFSGAPDEWWCHKHAHGAGYCWSCGYFWGGVESFDFRANGLCDNCDEMFKTDMGEYDEDEEYWEPDCP